MAEQLDWFDDDAVAAHQASVQMASLQVSRLHTIFATDPRGVQLLEMWREVAQRRVPVNATIDEYARAEAVRSFVQTIEDHIKLASQGAN